MNTQATVEIKKDGAVEGYCKVVESGKLTHLQIESRAHKVQSGSVVESGMTTMHPGVYWLNRDGKVIS